MKKIFKSELRGEGIGYGEVALEFCPKCGKRLVVQKDKEKGAFWTCPKCQFTKKVEGHEIPFVSVAVKTQKPYPESIAVIGKEEQKLRTLPTVKMECPRCENKLAFAWQVQTRGSDESSTQFFRCTKCNFTFREYT